MKERIKSLDVFRGATIAGMILVNTPGSWDHVYAPLLHAKWHGLTPTDLVFPFFLFIVGVSISISLKNYTKVTPLLFQKLVKRAVLLIVIGLFLGAFPYFELAELRYPGVLQRIGIVFLIAALLHIRFSAKALTVISVTFLFGYWAAMALIPFPGGDTGSLQPGVNLAAWVDQLILEKHVWSQTKTWDPEGVLSTIPAIVTALTGILFGRYYFYADLETHKMKRVLLVATFMIMSGMVWQLLFPINKSLWTSSYVLVTSGIAIMALVGIHWLIDIKKWQTKLFDPFIHFGANAIVVYCLSGIIASSLWAISINESTLYQWIYKHVFLFWLSPYNASLAFAITVVLLLYLIAYLMYRKKVFVKV